jgi:hypothetical protein
MESNILFALLVGTNKLERPYKGMHIGASLNMNKDYLQKVPQGFPIFDVFLVKVILSCKGLASVSITERKNVDCSQFRSAWFCLLL